MLVKLDSIVRFDINFIINLIDYQYRSPFRLQILIIIIVLINFPLKISQIINLNLQ